MSYNPLSNSKLNRYLCKEERNDKTYYYHKQGTTCGTTVNTKLVDLDEAFSFYKDVVTTSGLPPGNIEGNGFTAVEYPANGEASDWMLAAHGIYAMSPELGTQDRHSENFFIADKLVLRQTLTGNYGWMKNTAFKLMSQINLKVQNVFEMVRSQYASTKVVVSLN